MKSEKQGRMTFYNMMILEGFIAMVWAAGAMGVYNLGLQAADASLATATIGVVCKHILGPVGGVIALLGVIVLRSHPAIRRFVRSAWQWLTDSTWIRSPRRRDWGLPLSSSYSH